MGRSRDVPQLQAYRGGNLGPLEYNLASSLSLAQLMFNAESEAWAHKYVERVCERMLKNSPTIESVWIPLCVGFWHWNATTITTWHRARVRPLLWR